MTEPRSLERSKFVHTESTVITVKIISAGVQNSLLDEWDHLWLSAVKSNEHTLIILHEVIHLATTKYEMVLTESNHFTTQVGTFFARDKLQ